MYWVKILSNSSHIKGVNLEHHDSFACFFTWRHTNLPWFLTDSLTKFSKKKSHLSEGWDGSRTAAFWAASHLKPVVGNAPRILGWRIFCESRSRISSSSRINDDKWHLIWSSVFSRGLFSFKPFWKSNLHPAQWFCLLKNRTVLLSDSHVLWCCFGSLSKDSSPSIRKGAAFCSSQASYQSN